MLAPSTITLRRPSGEADLILSRSSEGTGHNHHQRQQQQQQTQQPQESKRREMRCHSPSPARGSSVRCLSPSDGLRGVYHSAPVTASSSSNWLSSGSHSHVSTPCGDGHSPISDFFDVSNSNSGVTLLSATGSSPTNETGTASSPLASPEVRRRYWYRKLMKMKDDLDQVGSSLKQRASSAARRLSPSVRRRSTPHVAAVEVLHAPGLTVHIVREMDQSSVGARRGHPTVGRSSSTSHRRTRRHRSEERDYADDDDVDYTFSSLKLSMATTMTTSDKFGYIGNGRSAEMPAQPGGSASPSTSGGGVMRASLALPATASLMLTGLRDGRFSGRVALDWLPPTVPVEDRIGDEPSEKSLTVRIRDYRLEFYTSPPMATSSDSGRASPSAATGGHVSSKTAAKMSPISTVSRLIYCGAASLPIYVDPGSLDFKIESMDGPDGSVIGQLIVEGRMKGCSIRLPPSDVETSGTDAGKSFLASDRKKPLSASASDVTLLAKAGRLSGGDVMMTSSGAMDDPTRKMIALSVNDLEITLS